MARSIRLTCCLALLTLLSTACEVWEVTPGFEASEAVLDKCGGSEKQLTGDLTADLVGGWRQATGGAHPLTALASSPQVLVFEPDGTGQIWWTHKSTTDATGGHLAFDWKVEDGHLIVNDLPPAEVIQGGPGDVRVRAPGQEDLTEATAWRHCGDELEIPET